MPVVRLYRCRTPTNWLCPCGRVSRELIRHGIDHEEVRLARGRAARAPVDELTGQTRVPVLLVGDEAIADSKRIVEHLRWRAAKRPGS